MSYETITGSAEDGNPIQLFRFGIGPGSYLAYTDHTEDLTVDHGGSVGSIDYEAVPIERGNIVSNGTLDKTALAISTDIGTDLAELFRVYPPSHVVTLVIYEGHIDDPDDEFVVIWAGRVIAGNREGSELKLSGEPISTQLRRPGLRRHYQYGCPHALYSVGDGLCNADKNAATVSTTVSAIDGTVITLAGGWEGAFPAAKFARGQLEWTPAGSSLQIRTILRVDGDDITLSGIPTGLAVSDNVDVILGCNHRAFAADGGDCEGLHDNLPSYGGQPWIPTKNVINANPFY